MYLKPKLDATAPKAAPKGRRENKQTNKKKKARKKKFRIRQNFYNFGQGKNTCKASKGTCNGGAPRDDEGDQAAR